MLRHPVQSPWTLGKNVVLVNQLETDVFTLEEPAFVFQPKNHVRSLFKQAAGEQRKKVMFNLDTIDPLKVVKQTSCVDPELMSQLNQLKL